MSDAVEASKTFRIDKSLLRDDTPEEMQSSPFTRRSRLFRSNGGAFRNAFLAYGQNPEELIVPGSLHIYPRSDDREPDAHRWLVTTWNAMSDQQRVVASFGLRRAYIAMYGFVIPTREGMDWIVKHACGSPIVDFGCGNGYLSYLLRQYDIRVVAVDNAPPETGNNLYWNNFIRIFHALAHEFFDSIGPVPTEQELRRHWTAIKEGSVEVISDNDGFPNATLLLSWPPKDETAAQALRAFRGNRLAYIGEDAGACNADMDFFSELAEYWTEAPTPEYAIASFEGMHDRLYWFVRK